MSAILQNGSKIDHRPNVLLMGLLWGVLGGLVATFIMDILLMGILVAFGMPASTCFSIVGDTAASLFSPGARGTSASILLGIAAHYLIGPVMGAVFGIAAAKIPASRLDSRKKILLLAILYAEILSQPLLAAAAVILRMTAAERLEWFGGSTVMHLIWGCILGLVWIRGLRTFVSAVK